MQIKKYNDHFILLHRFIDHMFCLSYFLSHYDDIIKVLSMDAWGQALFYDDRISEKTGPL